MPTSKSISGFQRRADLRFFLSIIAAGLLSFTGVVIETAMNITFPTLMQEFAISTSTVQWITTGYLLILAIVIPTSSYLKQRFAMKRLFLAANLLFLTGTLLDATSASFAQLLFGRLLQGAGTGIALPLMFLIVMEQAPLDKMGLMMGAAMLVCALAPAVGPSVGGYIVSTFGWRMIFIALLPVLLFSLAAGTYAIRQSSDYGPRPFDSRGLILLGAAFTAFLLLTSYLHDLLSEPLLLALLLLLLPCFLPLSADAPGGPLPGFCPDGKVPRTDTPIYNGPSPASVVHDYRVEFRQLDAHRGEAHFVRSVTVHSPYGADAARFAVVSSRFIHLKDFKGTVHGAGGKQLARLRRSDLREATLNDGLASDDRLHYYEGPRGSFPFTVRYEWTCTYDNGLLHYPDFRPQDDIRQAVEHASYTLTLPASVRLLYRSRGLAAHPEESADADAGTRTYRWQADDLPAAVPREDTVWEPPTVQAQPADFV